MTTVSEASDMPHTSKNSGTTLPSVSNAKTTTGVGHEDDQDSSEELDDRILLLDDEEASQFKDFDPQLVEEDSWKPPAPMLRFLGKHFNPEKNLQHELYVQLNEMIS